MGYVHPWIYVPDSPREGEITIIRENYTHLARSMRVKVGDSFRLFNGAGLVASAIIDSITRSEIRARIIDVLEIDNNPAVKLTLAFGLLPPSPLKTLLAGATQLGVYSLRPFMSSFNDIRIDPKESKRVVDRWRKIIIENSAVAGRSHIPEISPPVELKDCFIDVDRFDFQFTFWEEGGCPWRDLLPLDKGEVIAVIGPKGGLSEEEISILKSKGFEIVSFGELILKAEIAAISACARIIGR